MPDKAKSNQWLERLTAELEESWAICIKKARVEAARHLAKCSDDEASALQAALDERNDELMRQLPFNRPVAVISALLRRQEIVLGALQAFEGRKSQRQ